MNDLDMDLSQVLELKAGIKKARLLAVYGLTTDGAHHKQWLLEQVLIALGVDPADVCKWLCENGYAVPEDGIAP